MANPTERVSSDRADEVEEVDDDSSESINVKIADLRTALLGGEWPVMVQNLPPAVKRRIKALKKLQLETTNIEAKFFEEVHKLECKYHELYSPLYTKREHIVIGIHEPTDEECDFPSDDEKEVDELANDVTKKIDLKEQPPQSEEEVVGIPDFWLTIFKNVVMLSDMVQPHDEPILKHLLDVKVIFLPADPMGFVLEFHFGPNEYFSNSVLVKEYEMKCKPDESDPFSFDGPEIYKCKGCIIDWCKGKNVTVKTIKKRQKHKSRAAVRTVTKTIQNDSFFNFFSPPHVPEDQDTELDEDTRALLTSDFEIGHYIREMIIPRAVLYFTGEALEDEEDEEDEETEDEDEEEDEEFIEDKLQKISDELPKAPHDCKQQ